MKLIFSKLSTTQKIIASIFVLALIFFMVNSRSSKKEQSENYTVKVGNISEEIVISGNANTSGNASIYSPSTGIVEEVLVKNGDIVKAKQTVLKIKSTASEVDKLNALAAYRAAVSTLNSTKQAKEVNQSLLESARKSVIDGSVAVQQMNERRSVSGNNPSTSKQYTQNEVDSVLSSFTSSKQSFAAVEKKYLNSDGEIQAAQSAVSAAWLSYQATENGELKAPVGGKITNLAVNPGDSVKAKTSSLLTSETMPVFLIASQESVSIIVQLSELDVIKVRPGQKVSIVFDALPDKTFDALVSRVDSVGVNLNAVVTFAAYITVIGSDERLLPAMTATVTIKTDEKKGVLLLPNAALKRDNQSVTVEVEEDNKRVTKVVKVGRKNMIESEIISGLDEGDKVIVTSIKK